MLVEWFLLSILYLFESKEAAMVQFRNGGEGVGERKC